MGDIVQLGNVYPTKKRENPNQGRVYSVDGLSPAINCMTDGNRQPMILVKDMNKIIQIGNKRDDTKNFSNPQTGRVYSVDGITPTLNTCQKVDWNQKY